MPLYCWGLVTARGWILSGHLLTRWQGAAVLSMPTFCFSKVGEAEPGSVTMPQRWHGAGFARFSGVSTKNSWGVWGCPLKMLLSLLVSTDPWKLLSWSHCRCSLLLSSSNGDNMQAAAMRSFCVLLLHHGLVLVLGVGGEKMAENRQETGET